MWSHRGMQRDSADRSASLLERFAIGMVLLLG
jgi:hypothetical protein